MYGEVDIDSCVWELEALINSKVDENSFTGLCTFLYDGYSMEQARRLFVHTCSSCHTKRPMHTYLTCNSRSSPRCSKCRRTNATEIIPPLTYFISSFQGENTQSAFEKIHETHSSQALVARECSTAIECIYELNNLQASLSRAEGKIYLSFEKELIANIERAEGIRYEGNGRFKQRICYRC